MVAAKEGCKILFAVRHGKGRFRTFLNENLCVSLPNSSPTFRKIVMPPMLNVDVLGLEIWFLIFSLVRGSSSFNQLVLILILVFVPSNPPVKLKEIFQIEVSPTHASPRCW